MFVLQDSVGHVYLFRAVQQMHKLGTSLFTPEVYLSTHPQTVFQNAGSVGIRPASLKHGDYTTTTTTYYDDGHDYDDDDYYYYCYCYCTAAATADYQPTSLLGHLITDGPQVNCEKIYWLAGQSAIPSSGCRRTESANARTWGRSHMCSLPHVQPSVMRSESETAILQSSPRSILA